MGVVPDVAAEIVSGPTWEDAQHDVVTITRDEAVSHVAPRAVASHRDDDVVALFDSALGQVALLSRTSGRPICYMVERFVQKCPIGVDPPAPPPSTGRRVEDDEVLSSGQTLTILSNVCSPFPYHSSRNG